MPLKKIVLEADSLEEAKTKVKSQEREEGLPVLYEKVLCDGKEKTITASADTMEEAFAKAEKELPNDANILEKKQVSAPQTRVTTIEAFDEQSARSQASKGVKTSRIVDTKLKTMGKKGFLGKAKTPNQYEVTEFEPAKVEITYKPKAKILVKMGNDSEMGLCAGCGEKIFGSEYQQSLMAGLVLSASTGSSFSLNSQTEKVITATGCILECTTCHRYLCPECAVKPFKHLHNSFGSMNWCPGRFEPPHL